MMGYFSLRKVVHETLHLGEFIGSLSVILLLLLVRLLVGIDLLLLVLVFLRMLLAAGSCSGALGHSSLRSVEVG